MLTDEINWSARSISGAICHDRPDPPLSESPIGGWKHLRRSTHRRFHAGADLFSRPVIRIGCATTRLVYSIVHNDVGGAALSFDGFERPKVAGASSLAEAAPYAFTT